MNVAELDNVDEVGATDEGLMKRLGISETMREADIDHVRQKMLTEFKDIFAQPDQELPLTPRHSDGEPRHCLREQVGRSMPLAATWFNGESTRREGSTTATDKQDSRLHLTNDLS